MTTPQKGTLDHEKERRHDEGGVVWKVCRTQNQTPNSQPKWEAKFFLLQATCRRSCSVPVRHEEDGARLGFWLQTTQRHQMKQGTLAFEMNKTLIGNFFVLSCCLV
jgi:hypothetical protein